MKTAIWSLAILALASTVAADEWCHNGDGQAWPDCVYCCQQECSPHGVQRCISCCDRKGTYCNGKEVAGGDCENPAQ